MSVNAHVPGSTGQVFVLPVRYVLLRFAIDVVFGQPEICVYRLIRFSTSNARGKIYNNGLAYNVNDVVFVRRPSADDEIFGLDVSEH